MRKQLLLTILLAIALLVPVGAEPEPGNSSGEKAEKHWTLEDCLKQGVSMHPQVKIAASTVASSKARLLQARSGHDPQVAVRASWQRSKSELPARPPTDNTSESLSVSKTLYDSGQRELSERAARESVAAAQARYDSTLTDIAASIKNAYFRAQQAQALLQVRLETLAGYESHLEKVEGFVEVGSRPPFDITRAQVDVANARVDLISARSQLKVSLANLSRAIGLETSISIAGVERIDLPNVDSAAKEQLLQEAMQRPEIRAAEFQRKAADFGVKEARKSLSPSFSASADYRWSGNISPQDRQWGMGVSMSWPVFDGSLTRARIDSAKSQLDNSAATIDNLRLAVAAELENSITGVSDAVERYAATSYLVQQASESLHLAEARYDAGLSSPIEITDARVEYARARGSQVVSYFDGLIAWSELDRVLGRLPAEISQIEITDESSDGSSEQ